MKIFTAAKRLFLIGVMILASSTGLTAPMVGKVTEVSRDAISIDDTAYRISGSALRGKGPGERGRLKLNDLETGQIVKFTYDRDRISALELLHGETDIPN